MVQNQRSAEYLAKKWDRTGVVVECPGYDKYTIRMDGSGNVTNRNRKYLRPFIPDHAISPPSLTRPCMELPRRMEAAAPAPVEGTLSTEEAQPPAAQEDHVPVAPQVQTYAEVAAAPLTQTQRKQLHNQSWET